MKIIQSYNTFGNDPDRKKCGFTTIRSMIAFLEQSYEIHSQNDYLLYTDEYGYDIVRKFIKDSHIQLFDYPIILNDRVPYVGKFQVQEIQKSAYVHVDIDAILYEYPKNSDVICEKFRAVSHGKETNRFGIDRTGLEQIICSGIIGFNDMNFKQLYITKVFEYLGLLVNSHNLTFETFYTIEEVLLTRMIIDYNKSVSVCENYFHLQGKLK